MHDGDDFPDVNGRDESVRAQPRVRRWTPA